MDGFVAVVFGSGNGHTRCGADDSRGVGIGGTAGHLRFSHGAPPHLWASTII